MKRMVILEIIKMVGEVILFTVIPAIIIVYIGYRNQWSTSLPYSNAFFVAGCLMIVAGGMTRMAAGGEWGSFQLLHAESFRNMSSSERAQFIVNASSSYRLVILGLSSGILLILMSWLVTKFF